MPWKRRKTPPAPRRVPEATGLTSPTSALSPISPWPPPLPVQTDLPSAKEIYGFLTVLLTYLAFFIYVVWAFCPPDRLDAIGWTWYPDREWAIIVPCYLMVVVLLTYLAYAGLSLYNTPSDTSMSLFTDPYSNYPIVGPNGEPYYWKFADPKAIPVACDFPLDLINRVLYPPPNGRPR